MIDDLPRVAGFVALVHEHVAGLGDLGALGGVEGDRVVTVVDGNLVVLPVQADVGLVIRHLEVGKAGKDLEVVVDFLRGHAELLADRGPQHAVLGLQEGEKEWVGE